MSKRLILFAAAATITLFAALQFLFFRYNDTLLSSDSEFIEKKTAPPPAPVVYGIATDSLEIVEGVIRSGQTVSTLLADYNIPLPTVHALAQKGKGVFPVNKIRRGQHYTVLHSRDGARTARYLIYEPNRTEYVIYDLRDSLNVELCQRPVEVVEREMAGEIHGSLYQSVLEAGGTAALVDQLADIYAWRLNLNHIQAGDTYKLIFEEKRVNGETIGCGQLTAAYIGHKGRPLYAIGFDQGEGLRYFDQDGQSFKKAFLKTPVAFTRISSRYTKRRFHPVQRRYKAHLGTDYAAPRGTPIRSVGDGVVVAAGRTRGNGNFVKIRHNKTYTTQYLHMSRFAKGIRRGSRVAMGQTIGYVGSTGLATGPHLCYRFWKNGRQVDALRVKLPHAQPVSEKYLTAFMNTKEQIVGRMEAMDHTSPSRDLIAAAQPVGTEPSI